MTSTGASPRADPTRVRVEPNPSVALVDVADESILYDERDGELIRLDGIGTAIMHAVGPGIGLEALVHDLSARFRTHPEVIQPDVVAFLGKLQEHDAIVVLGGPLMESGPA